MERLSELLFEFSNEDRLRIVTELAKEAMNLTSLSKHLSLTVQETSRHLSRLSKAKIIEKMSDGVYKPTPYGLQVIGLIPGFEFLSENREYFTSHTIMRLPREFVNRVGELSSSRLTENAIVLFQMVDTLVSEAKEYVWIMSDQALPSTLPLTKQALDIGAELRTLLPKDLGPPEIPDEMIPDFSEFRHGLMKNRHLDTVEVVVIMSEKKAVVAFPTLKEKMDYLGFSVVDDSGHHWCRDLYLHYWERGIQL